MKKFRYAFPIPAYVVYALLRLLSVVSIGFAALRLGNAGGFFSVYPVSDVLSIVVFSIAILAVLWLTFFSNYAFCGDTFVFTLNDVQQTVTLKALSNGSGTSFANMLNQCFREQNIPVTASAVSYSGKYRLKLTTADTGTGVSIGYSSAAGGSVSEKLYGDLTAAGSVTAGSVPVKESVTIEAGKNAGIPQPEAETKIFTNFIR